jgi:hypothetical protein
MSRYAIILHLDSTDRFAVLVEDSDGVDTYGISNQGKEWERWADSLPQGKRNTIEELLSTLGAQFSVQGPSSVTRTLSAEFEALAAAQIDDTVKDTVVASDSKMDNGQA